MNNKWNQEKNKKILGYCKKDSTEHAVTNDFCRNHVLFIMKHIYEVSILTSESQNSDTKVLNIQVLHVITVKAYCSRESQHDQSCTF